MGLFDLDQAGSPQGPTPNERVAQDFAALKSDPRAMQPGWGNTFDDLVPSQTASGVDKLRDAMTSATPIGQQFDPAEYQAWKQQAGPGMFDDLIPQQPPQEPQQQGSGWGNVADYALPIAERLPVVGPLATGARTFSPSDIAETWRNVPRSAGEFARNTVQPIIHPIETATNLKNLGLGILQKTGIVPGDQHQHYADAVGQFFVDRYGSPENAKRALITDPVGVAGDVSTLLSGGGFLAARAPGMIGRIGEAASTIGRATDPLLLAGKATKATGSGLAHVAGLTTGAGTEPFKIAARAGYEGGQGAQAFRENMTGRAPIEDVVNDARGAVQQMRRERGDAYRQQMAKIGADKTILSWNDVDTALNEMENVATYKGQSLSPSTEAVRNNLTAAVDDWKNLRASEFWTPEGFDALKRKIGDIRDSTEPHTPERVVADKLYSAIRKSIIDQAPDYAKAMKGYESASDQIKQIEKTLSQNPNASIDTALRKLQSTLRDNVNTSFGYRTKLANYLVNAGAPHLMEKLAGQALHAWMPRGLSRMVAAAGVEGLPLLAGGLTAAAKAAPALATMSPRVMGEAAYGIGKAARAASPIAAAARASRQIGQLPKPGMFDDLIPYRRQ